MRKQKKIIEVLRCYKSVRHELVFQFLLSWDYELVLSYLSEGLFKER